jgi:small subunit ribosomal protein S6
MMLIVPAEADDQVIGGVTDRISQVLSARGGRITHVDRWGRRRFAFPINKLTEGFYLVADFEGEPTTLKELERVLSLADDVIRFKIVVRPEQAKGAARVVPEPVREPVSAAIPDSGSREGQTATETQEAEPAAGAESEQSEPAEGEEAASVANTGTP